MADPAHKTDPEAHRVDESSAAALEEAIDSAFETVEEDLFATVCVLLTDVRPAAFARIVRGLVEAMGYSAADLAPLGGGRLGGVARRATALGPEDVYVEALCAAPATEIGRGPVQAFVGAWVGEGADRAALLTNGTLADAARDYLARVGRKVVVIDGLDLARLMISHEVGVERRRAYHLRGIDRTFFEERD